MYRVACPNCGQGMNYAVEHVGKKSRCRKCGTPVRLPAPGDAPKNRPHPPGKVTFRCPRCQRTARLASLLDVAVADAQKPTNFIGEVLKGIAAASGRATVDVGAVTVACPECSARFSAREVEELRGELLISCPHCEHTGLYQPLATSDIIKCSKCLRGFTGGIVSRSNGEWTGEALRQPAEPGASLLLTYQCVQTTCVYHTGDPRDLGRYAIMRQHSFHLIDPPVGTASVERTCPYCTKAVTFKTTSLDTVNKGAASVRRWAKLGVWLIALFPLAAAFIAVRYLLGAYNAPAVPPLDCYVAVATLLLGGFGLWSLYWRSDAYLRSVRSASKRVMMYFSPQRFELWSEPGFHGKKARLEVSHRLLTVEVKVPAKENKERHAPNG